MSKAKTKANQRWERKNPNYIKQWKKDNPQKIKSYRRSHRQRMQKIMTQLKINGCAICGYDKCEACLDFHHSNPKNKKFSIVVNGLGRTDKSLVEELNKCILLCNRCHGEKHWCNKEVENGQ